MYVRTQLPIDGTKLNNFCFSCVCYCHDKVYLEENYKRNRKCYIFCDCALPVGSLCGRKYY